MKMNKSKLLVAAVVMALAVSACGDDDSGSEADELGVGAECVATEDCPKYYLDGDEGEIEMQMECLQDFRGGYCGVQGCTTHEECPEGSMCVMYDTDLTYCFLSCVDKDDCNSNRSLDNQANCSASFDFADGMKESKICIPPSSN